MDVPRITPRLTTYPTYLRPPPSPPTQEGACRSSTAVSGPSPLRRAEVDRRRDGPPTARGGRVGARFGSRARDRTRPVNPFVTGLGARPLYFPPAARTRQSSWSTPVLARLSPGGPAPQPHPCRSATPRRGGNTNQGCFEGSTKGRPGLSVAGSE